MTLANTVNVIRATGLGEPYSVSDYVLAGTVIQWGGNPTNAIGGTPSYVQMDAAITILKGLSRFSNVSASTQGIINPYVSITLTSAMDRAHLADVLADIEGSFYQANLNPGTQAFWVSSVPAAASGNDGYVQPGTGGSVNPGATTSTSGGNVPGQVNPNAPPCPNPSLFCDCGYELSLFDLGCVPVGDPSTALDKLAKSLSITPTQAAIVGALGALLAVIAIGKIVK